MRTVNRLFRADFFGEKALLYDQPRDATVMVPMGAQELTCLCLGRSVFTDLLGPLEEIMAREKSAEVVEQRMRELEWAAPWMRANITIVDRKGRSESAMEGTCSNVTFVSLAPPDYKEQQAPVDGAGVEAAKEGGAEAAEGTADVPTVDIELREGTLLGGGASGTVRRVDLVDDRVGAGAPSRRSFALKRMRKTSVMSTPEHIFCERNVTREMTHWACMRQHASFKDETYLYFLLDFVDGCDLMDALAAVAAVTSVRDPAKTFAPKVKMLRGMPEDAARHYIATVALALEYLHDRDVVYRDLKPENVLLARDGSAKLGDFGFAKRLKKGAHTYTFCGTPGYVAPEVVLARGYGTSVDWWGLGVMTYVLLTGQQPFSQMVNGQPEDPLTVMKRIVDRSWSVSFPVYVSESAVDLIRKFLERRSVKRLGNTRQRAADVFDHPWFRDARFDWAALRDGALKPEPLALSADFEKQRARRVARLERSLKASRRRGADLGGEGGGSVRGVRGLLAHQSVSVPFELVR
jgi:cGMP-dependent protein kinase 2